MNAFEGIVVALAGGSWIAIRIARWWRKRRGGYCLREGCGHLEAVHMGGGCIRLGCRCERFR